MKRRVALWAGAGFLIASGFVLYTLLASPEQLRAILQLPLARDLVYVTCPVAYAGRELALPFWSVPLINAATYALIGLLAEFVRRKPSPRLAM